MRGQWLNFDKNETPRNKIGLILIAPVGVLAPFLHMVDGGARPTIDTSQNIFLVKAFYFCYHAHDKFLNLLGESKEPREQKKREITLLITASMLTC